MEREQGVPTTESDVVVMDKDAFDKAVADVVTEVKTDKNTEDGMGKMLFLMAGMSFAAMLRKKLFGENKEG